MLSIHVISTYDTNGNMFNIYIYSKKINTLNNAADSTLINIEFIFFLMMNKKKTD